MDTLLNASPEVVSPPPDAATSDAGGEKAWSVQARPALMLSLRFGRAGRLTYEYADLRGLRLLGDAALRLHFAQATVTLRGTNLEALADQLERHVVTCIREQHAGRFLLGRHAEYIERIDVGPPDPESLARRPVALAPARG